MGREKKTPKQTGWKKTFWLAGVAAVLLVGWIAWARVGTNDADEFLRGPRAASRGYVRREIKPPLSPARFVGQTARAYQIAHEIPEILDQLYCYCECDKHLGHKSLLSCFTDDHGAG